MFTTVVKTIVYAEKIRRFHHYIDDWLIIADTPQQTIRHARYARYVINLAISIGWIPNWSKSQLTPTQTFQYVGTQYHLREGLALPPAESSEDDPITESADQSNTDDST